MEEDFDFRLTAVEAFIREYGDTVETARQDQTRSRVLAAEAVRKHKKLGSVVATVSALTVTGVAVASGVISVVKYLLGLPNPYRFW